ncbi:MAG: FecR domain-containing protein [Symploca sp. SIO1A3]|nr:FecR domain-containing protein [Symploca sp. SIO1A3]
MSIKLNQSGFRSNYWQLFLTGLCFFLILSVLHHPTPAQSATINQGKITEILDSSQVYINGKRTRVNAIARRGQRVSTRNARAELSFNTGGVGRLAHNSVLTIGQCAHLRRGTLLVNGSVNGCTNSTVAGVRGTTYVLVVDENGQEEIKVLEGEVVLSKRVNQDIDEDKVIRGLGKKSASVPLLGGVRGGFCLLPSCTNVVQSELSTEEEEELTPETISLSAGEKVKIRPDGEVSPVQPLTAEEFEQLLLGQLFNNFSSELPGISKIKQSFENLFPDISFPSPLPDLPVKPPVPPSPFRF